MEEKISLSEQMRSSTYPIDVTSGAEIARLIDQSKLMSLAMGGLMPNAVLLSPGMRILDLACGPGAWATEMAYQYPDIEVVGVDCNPVVVEYDRVMAKVQHVENASFLELDIKEPLEFVDNSVDLVHGRFLAGVLDQNF